MNTYLPMCGKGRKQTLQLLWGFYFVALVQGASRGLLQSQRQSLCNAWIDVFTDTCSPSKQEQFQGFVNELKGTLAVCCPNKNCCQQLNGIIDAGCLELMDDQLELNSDLLQAIGLHATVCTGTGSKLPTTISQRLENREDDRRQIQDNDDEDSEDEECNSLASELITECGFLNEGANLEFQIGNQSVGCCWPSSCCSKSEQYYRAGCSLECRKDNAPALFVRNIAQPIAQMWREACVLDLQASGCQDSDSIEEGDLQAKMKTTMLEDLMPPDEVAIAKSPELDNQQQKDVCEELDGVIMNLDVEVQTARTFCHLEELASLRSFGDTQITGCCNIVRQIMDTLCAKHSCFTDLPPFFDDGAISSIFKWQVVCKPTIETCPFVDTLLTDHYQLRTENNEQELEADNEYERALETNERTAKGENSEQEFEVEEEHELALETNEKAIIVEDKHEIGIEIDEKEPIFFVPFSPAPDNLALVEDESSSGLTHQYDSSHTHGNDILHMQGYLQSSPITIFNNYLEKQPDQETSIVPQEVNEQKQNEPQQKFNHIEIIHKTNISMFDALKDIPDILFFNLAVHQLNLKEKIQKLGQNVMVLAALDSAFHEFARRAGMNTQGVVDELRVGSLNHMIQQNILLEQIDLEDAIGEAVEVMSLNGVNLAISVDIEKQQIWAQGCCLGMNKAKILSGCVFKEGLLVVVDTLIMPPGLVDIVYRG